MENNVSLALLIRLQTVSSNDSIAYKPIRDAIFAELASRNGVGKISSAIHFSGDIYLSYYYFISMKRLILVLAVACTIPCYAFARAEYIEDPGPVCDPRCEEPRTDVPEGPGLHDLCRNICECINVQATRPDGEVIFSIFRTCAPYDPVPHGCVDIGDCTDGPPWNNVQGSDTRQTWTDAGGSWIWRNASNAIIAHDKISSGYVYEMNYAQSRTIYRVSEMRHNGAVLTLYNWSESQIVGNLNDGALATVSRSNVFTINSGDNISVFREFFWQSRIDGRIRPNNYVALDNLQFNIELVNSSTGAVIGIVDAFGVDARTTPGIPVFHSSYNLVAIPMYTVPPSLTGLSVYLRVNAAAQGGGQYYFKRYSARTFDYSGRASNSYYISYNQNFGAGLPKTVVPQSLPNDCNIRSKSNIDLSILPNPSRGEFKVHFRPNRISNSAIAVYREDGALVSSRLLTETEEKEGVVQLGIADNGRYFVTLIANSSILGAVLTTVVK